MTNALVKLGVDLAKGKVQNFSKEEANEKLREKFAELTGYSVNSKGKYDKKLFRKNKIEIFEIIEQIVDEYLQEGLKDQFEGFAEYRNLAWGDTNEFYTPSDDIYRVALISDGNDNLRRQRLRDGQSFSVSVDTYGIKLGEDLLRFLSGRVDWAEFISKIAESFKRDLTQRIYDAVYASYGKYNATYHKTGTITEDDLVTLAMHIEARTGSKPVVYGTKLALRKLAPSAVTDEMKNEKNKVGFYGMIAGIELREIAQSHQYGTDTFAIDNSFVLVLPQDADKMVKVINEGESFIKERNGGQNSDDMQEYFVSNRFGIAIICSRVFGFLKLT